MLYWALLTFFFSLVTPLAADTQIQQAFAWIMCGGASVILATLYKKNSFYR